MPGMAEVLAPRTAYALAAMAQQAKQARDDAHKRKCTAERDRVQAELDTIDPEQYWSKLEQAATMLVNVKDRATSLTTFEHVLIQQSPDSDVLDDVKTHVVMPWVRNKLCKGAKDHGFSVVQEQDGPRLQLRWTARL